MSHHNHSDHDDIDHAFEHESNSTVDAFAILGLVIVVVAMAVYYVSR